MEVHPGMTAWEFSGTSRARVQAGDFQGWLDPRFPALGFQEVTWKCQSMLAGWLAIDVGRLERDGQSAEVEALAIDEAYVRGRDLIVRYGLPTGRSTYPRLLWSVESRDGYVVVELRVYLQTDLLASDPRVRVHCAFPLGTETATWDGQAWQHARKQETEMASFGVNLNDASLRCHRLRIPGSSASCGLIVRGTTDAVTSIHDEEDSLRWQCELFPESLEKGVIRVGQVWGVLTSRDGDERRLVECLSTLQASKLPLTT